MEERTKRGEEGCIWRLEEHVNISIDAPFDTEDGKSTDVMFNSAEPNLRNEAGRRLRLTVRLA